MSKTLAGMVYSNSNFVRSCCRIEKLGNGSIWNGITQLVAVSGSCMDWHIISGLCKTVNCFSWYSVQAFVSWAASFRLNEAPSVLYGLNLMNCLSLTTESAQGNASQSNCKRTGAYTHFVVSPLLEVATYYKNKIRTSNKAYTYTGQWWLSPCFPSAGLWSASVSLCYVTSSLAQTVSYVI